MTTNLFKLELDRPVCLSGLSEDDIRELVNAISVSVTNDEFKGFALVSGGNQVTFRFGPDGNFQGIYAKVGGKNIVLFPGAGSSNLQVFKGVPSATNPGEGWTVETDLTREILGQPIDENQWKLFYASRVGVINNT